MTIVVLIIAAVFALPFITELMRKPMNAGIRTAAEGKFVTLSRGVTHYDWLGPANGPVAVCVHGLTTPSFVWRGLARGLVALGYRVLIYDHYGRGYSDRPGGAQDRRFFLDQLSELLESQDVQQEFTLIGYSMGGTISTAWAAENPDRVRRLILIASAGVVVDAGRTAQFMRQTPIFGDWLMYAFFPRSHRKGTEADRSLPSSVENVIERQQDELRYRGFVPAVLRSMRGVLSTNSEADHRKLHDAGVPVLAIWGGQDTLIPVRAAGKLAEWNRDCHQEVIEAAGHSLTFTHTPDVLAAITGFVTEDSR